LAWNESTTIRFKSSSEMFSSTAEVSENAPEGSAARAPATIDGSSRKAAATCLTVSIALARIYADTGRAGSANRVTFSNSHA